MSLPRLIGLYSPAPQSGKSTIATYLTTHGYDKIPFADPIRRMAGALLHDLGYPAAEAARLLHKDKHETIPEIRATPRALLQTLGTEWGRLCIRDTLWTDIWRHKADRTLQSNRSVVCDDVRFPNEAELILAMGGELWMVTRPGTTRPNRHTSEGSLDNFPTFHRRLVNDGTLLDLYTQLREIADSPLK